MREVAEIHEKKVSDLVLHNTTDVASAHTSQFARITSMSKEMVGFDEVLILIDDVWETIAWDDLKPCFCDAKNGSRIIVTTRLGDVASHAKLVSDPHYLRLFSPEESWMLLKTKVFNKNSCPLILEDAGKR
ncbi:hypothetical protein HAX54_033320 [Datura stramonium]|uniref:NB-ARC domain-containing protein n=1 Tax=Datura stramonium TaxID=4076 RepID=A0ABS8SD79_DATST|nr:hypothetical protein [Datura stramonium]